MVESRRSGTKFAFGGEGKEIVSMLNFRNTLYVATKEGVYSLRDDKFRRLELVEESHEN